MGNVRSLYYHYAHFEKHVHPEPFLALAELFSDVGNYLREIWTNLSTKYLLSRNVRGIDDRRPGSSVGNVEQGAPGQGTFRAARSRTDGLQWLHEP